MTLFESNLDVDDGLGLFKKAKEDPWRHETADPNEIDLTFLEPSMLLYRPSTGDVSSSAYSYYSARGDGLMTDINFKVDPRKAVIAGMKPANPENDAVGLDYILITFNSSGAVHRYGIDLYQLIGDENGNFHISHGGSLTTYSDRTNIKLPSWLMFKAKMIMRQYQKNPKNHPI